MKMKYIVSYQPTARRRPSTTPIKIIAIGHGPVAHLTPADARVLAAALLKQADDLDASTTYPVVRGDGRIVRVSVPPSDND